MLSAAALAVTGLAVAGPAQAAAPASAPAAATAPSSDGDLTKPRVLVLTDAEIDDRSTMVRFLMYSSDYDVAGIIEQNSVFQQHGHSAEDWFEDEIAAYEAVWPNLVKHNPDYPTADYLRSVTKVGNEDPLDLIRAPKDMQTRGTEGEQQIIKVLTDDDPRPILTTCWGGCNTLAQALWTIQTTHPKADLDRALAKIRLYVIWYQDNGGRWIEQNYPQVQIFEAYQWDDIWDYQATTGPAPDYIHDIMTADWLNENVKQNHGPLGAYTPQDYISEGDTPSFMNAVNNGLQDAAYDFTLGGWGSRAALDYPYLKPNHYTDFSGVADDGDAYKQYWRWLPAAQNDFAARMDWSVADSYEDANHQPVAKQAGDLHRVAQPGDTVTLDVSASTDPDGDTLSYRFWQYADADSVEATVDLTGADTSTASFVVPDEPGTQVQVIAEVTDDGSPSLTSYRRFLVDIGHEYDPGRAARPADAIDWSSPQTVTGDADVSTAGTLVRAVNLTAADDTASPTVNGVEFTAAPRSVSRWVVPGSVRAGEIANLPGGDTVTYAESASRAQAGVATGIAPAGLGDAYSTLLGTAFSNSADESVPSGGSIGRYAVPVSQNERANLNLTLTGLTPGTSYEVQLWSSDQRIDTMGVADNTDLTTILRDQGGDAVLQQNVANTAGAAGQYVVGRFTATSDSKVISVIGGPGAGRGDNRTALLNAYQLREVPSATDSSAIPVVATLPAIGTVEGTLSMSIADFGDGVTLSEPTSLGDRLRLTGTLPKVTVSDTRNDTQAAGSGWSVTGHASAFSSDDERFSSAYLGWKPRSAHLRDGVVLGSEVLGSLEGGPGLDAPASLLSAPADARLGSSAARADLRLEVPVDTAEGTYTSQLSVSLFPVD